MTGISCIQMAALDRPLVIGSLYDLRTDKVCSGETLWSQAVMNNSVKFENKVDPPVTTTLIDCESFEKRALALGLDGDSKLSLLCGMLNVPESQAALVNNRTTLRTKKAVIHCSIISKVEKLPEKTIQHLTMEANDILDGGDATHVVIRVGYGLDAFITAELNADFDEEAEKTYPVLLTKLQKICKNKRPTTEFENVTCSVTGDIAVKQTGLTFQSAVDIVMQLPKLLKNDLHRAVPKYVLLYPLRNLSPTAAKVENEINRNLVRQAIVCVTNMETAKLKVVEVSLSPVCSKLEWLGEDLKTAVEAISEHLLATKAEIARILSGVRAEKVLESDLKDLVGHSSAHLFDPINVDAWRTKKDKELSLLSGFLKQLEGVKCCQTQEKLQKFVKSLQSQFVCSLEINTSRMEDPFLKDLRAASSMQTLTGGSTRSWFEDAAFLRSLQELVKNFTDFAEVNNGDKEKVTFVFSSSKKNLSVVSTMRCFVYEAGEPTAFVPPAQPTDLEVSGTTSDTISLQWNMPQSGSSAITITHYLCSYRHIDQSTDLQKLYSTADHQDQISPKWKEMRTGKNETRFTLMRLCSGTDYEVRVASVCDLGMSKFTTISGFIHTESAKTESKIISDEEVKSTARSFWQRSSQEVELPNIDTPPANRFIESIIKHSVPVSETEPQIFQVRTHVQSVSSDAAARVFKYVIGDRPLTPTAVNEKVILILGPTGAGKSTLINAMFNYIFNVKFNDNVRFRVVTEAAKATGMSMTDPVSAYTVYGQFDSPVKSAVTIVDTPGFMDTTGIERDEEIKTQLHRLFSGPGDDGIDHIDAIGIVVQSSQGRITAAQKYIFNSVMSIFGKDIRENIFLMCTFADNKKPEVLKAIEADGLPFKQWFPFNNCALYETKDEVGPFTELYWKMVTTSIFEFFQGLERTEPKSLNLTVQVLGERRRLEACINGLQPQVRAGLGKMEEIRQTKDILSQHQMDINNNEHFEIVVNVPAVEKFDLPVGVCITNCLTCNRTCHYQCNIRADKDKRGCAAMGKFDGNCTVCLNKCNWTQHCTNQFGFKDVIVRQTRTIEEVKNMYGVAVGKKGQAEQLLKNVEEALKVVADVVTTMIKDMRDSAIRLNKIALCPNVMTSHEYIELLIQAEELERKPGFKQRVNSLKLVQESAKILEGVLKGDPAALVSDADPVPLPSGSFLSSGRYPNTNHSRRKWLTKRFGYFRQGVKRRKMARKKESD